MIESFRIPSEGEGTVLPVVPHQTDPSASRAWVIARARPQGQFDLWLCDACGYSELWARGLSGLREDPAGGVRMIDTTVTPEGPFR